MNVLDDSNPIVYYARNNNLPVTLVESIIDIASARDINYVRIVPGDNPDIVRIHSYYGLMALKASDAIKFGLLGDVNKLFDPKVNLEIGCRMLRKFKNDYTTATGASGYSYTRVLQTMYPLDYDKIDKVYEQRLQDQVSWDTQIWPTSPEEVI